MHIRARVLLVALVCQSGPAPAAPAASDAKSPAPHTSGKGVQPAKDAAFYQEREIVSLAAQTKAVKRGKLLVCGEAGSKNCVCVEPLPCESQGNCVSFEDNVAAFRKALAVKEPGRSVECRRAEIGACGSFRYFDFEGDIARREVRWFDTSGRLVAQRNATDDEEYCGGKSRTRFQGKVPRCDRILRTELICGAAESDLPLPIEDVLKRRLEHPGPESR